MPTAHCCCAPLCCPNLPAGTLLNGILAAQILFYDSGGKKKTAKRGKRKDA